MEPLISLLVHNPKRTYRPGDSLQFEFQIDAIDAADIQAVEASVMWHTEGKGDQNLGIHFFDRRVPSEVAGGDLRPLKRLQTLLPCSPLSYAGVIVKIQWCVRIRVFLRRGKEVSFEQPFQLSDVAPGKAVVVEPKEPAESAAKRRQ